MLTAHDKATRQETANDGVVWTLQRSQEAWARMVKHALGEAEEIRRRSNHAFTF
jgi:hypothetical protein